MAKKQNNTPPTPARDSPKATTPAPDKGFSLSSFKVQALILAIVGFLLYGNTLNHEYAFDDMMAIVNNEYVQKGVSGIGEIMTQDAYQSYLVQRNGGNQLSGGRYRPLSLVSFAIEQQLLGVDADADSYNGVAGGGRSKDSEAKLLSDMHFRHGVNVLLYIACLIVLLRLFQTVFFPNDTYQALWAVLLFAVHPLHTEVVANVKSRDELLSVLFIGLTFLSFFKEKKDKGINGIAITCIYFFLALLSKEYAATLLVLLPLCFYIVKRYSAGDSVKAVLPLLVPFGIYMLLRLSSVVAAAEGAEKDIMNYPYLFASGVQKLATECWVLLRYLQMLFVPYPLCADYSFRQIPYYDFSNVSVLVSVVVHTAWIGGMVWAIAKRHILGLASAIYWVNILLIANFFFNIGAPMGERLVFHSSIGMVVIVAWLLFEAQKKWLPAVKPALWVLLAVVGTVYGYITINRNPAWKNNTTLFLTDVKTSPNSALTNSNAGAAYMGFAKQAQAGEQRNRIFDTAIQYFDRVIAINPKHHLAYLNRGLCNYNSGHPEKAVYDWAKVRELSPGTSNLQKYLAACEQMFYIRGTEYKKTQKIDSAVWAFRLGTIAAPQAGEMWYELAQACIATGNTAEAQKAIAQAKKWLGNDPRIKNLEAGVLPNNNVAVSGK
ncbi:MAG: hypothetical protein EBX41_00215 [Chitinophagia bacterium]|nr:hypothetical protein [Chitinophagia bacterium]